MQDLIIGLQEKRATDESISSFSEAIGNVPTPWEKGEVITFPHTIEGNAFKTLIGNERLEYIVVHVKCADGSEREDKFFPSLFRKRVRKCEWDIVDGVNVATPTNYIFATGGSIVEPLYTKKSKVNDIVLAVLGKSIKISNVREVKSIEYGSRNPELAKVYDFEPEGWSIHNGHEYVDLGLSSGLKWATCNVGANSPEEEGNYYAWAETETKETHDSSNALTYGLTFSELESHGYIDSESNLTPLHDAATVNWGAPWRMPTLGEIEELELECIWEWTTQNGVNGYKVTGPNDNSIFLPANGDSDGDSFYYTGAFWSSTRYNYHNNLAYVLTWGRNSNLNWYETAYHNVGVGYSYYSSNVRPVLE